MIYFQAGARRWLVLRRSAPVWSQLLAPRVISEERARQLQLEIDIWQQKTKLWVDREETTKLHVEVITAFALNLNPFKQCYDIFKKMLFYIFFAKLSSLLTGLPTNDEISVTTVWHLYCLFPDSLQL